MASYFLLAMACIAVIKPLQAALYLSEVKFDYRLPLIYAGLALLAGPIAVLHRYLTRRYTHVAISSCTLGFFVLSLALMAFALSHSRGFWTCFLFVVWSGIFSLLLPALGWVIAYDLFTVREAKRLFALLGAGGIVGAVIGGFYTALVGKHLIWLMMQVVLMLLLLQVLVLLIYRTQHGRRETGLQLAHAPGARVAAARPHGVRELLTSSHTRYLAGVVLAAALATTVIDLNYQWYASKVYGGTREDLTRLFGSVLGTMGLLAAMLQIFASRRILQRFGLPVTLLIPPLALGAGSLFVGLRPGFWPVLGVKALDGALRPSFHLTGVEMSYLVLTDRRSALPLKSFIDLAVSRFGDAMGALLFLFLSSVLVHEGQLVAGVQVLLFALWACLALQLGRAYVDNLRRRVQEGVAVPLAVAPEEGRAEEIVLEALRSSDPARIRLALRQIGLHDSREEEPAPAFPFQGEDLMQKHILGIGSAEPRWLEIAGTLLEHPDPEIGAAAFRLMIRHNPARHLKALQQQLDSEWLPPLYCLHYLDRYTERTGKFLRPVHVLRWCQNLPAEQRGLMARLLGKSGNRAYLSLLRQWAQEECGPSACAAVEALGKFAEPRFLSFLTGFLCSAWSRPPARRAVASYGEIAVSHLSRLLRDPESDPRIKREIPLILGLIRSSSSRAALISALYQSDPQVSYRALKALNQIRNLQDLSFVAGTYLPVIDLWARQYYGYLNLESAQEQDGGSGWGLLRRTLLERKSQALEKIFRTLELFLPRGDAYYSYQILIQERGELRDHAIELIDAQLSPRLKQTVLPFLTERNAAELADTGRRLYGLPDEPALIISDALLEADPWLRCCVLATAHESAVTRREACRGLIESVQRCCDDVNPLVRDTALWALVDLQAVEDSRSQPRGAVMLRAIEKALLLQEFELLQFASADHLMQLAETCREETFRAGETIFRAAEPAHKLYLLVSGEAIYEGPGGPPLRKGALNLWPCLAQSGHPEACRCVTDCTVLTLATEDLLGLLAGEPELSLALLKHLAAAHLQGRS